MKTKETEQKKLTKKKKTKNGAKDYQKQTAKTHTVRKIEDPERARHR